MQNGLRQSERQACIASSYRMTDLISLAGVKKKYVVGIGHGLIVADVPQVNPAIGKYELRGGGAFFRAAMTARTAAADVSQGHGISAQQMADFEFRHSG